MTHFSPPDLDKIIEKLTATTRSPRGEYSAEKGYPILRQKIQRRRFRVYLHASAAIAALLIAGVMGWSIYQFTQPIEIHTISTLAETKEIILPDGSQVILNRFSSLKYPERFTKGTRSVSLEGEAYFEIAKDRDNPFQVNTGEIQVEVLGTVFNVEAYPSDPLITTSLFEGSVAVNSQLSDERLILAPGDMARFNKQNNELIHESGNQIGDINSWIQGTMVFHQTPLDEILRRLSNQYHLQIVLEEPQLQDYKITATFHNSQAPEEVLALLQEIIPFTYTLQTPSYN